MEQSGISCISATVGWVLCPWQRRTLAVRPLGRVLCRLVKFSTIEGERGVTGNCGGCPVLPDSGNGGGRMRALGSALDAGFRGGNAICHAMGRWHHIIVVQRCKMGCDPSKGAGGKNYTRRFFCAPQRRLSDGRVQISWIRRRVAIRIRGDGGGVSIIPVARPKAFWRRFPCRKP